MCALQTDRRETHLLHGEGILCASWLEAALNQSSRDPEYFRNDALDCQMLLIVRLNIHLLEDNYMHVAVWRTQNSPWQLLCVCCVYHRVWSAYPVFRFLPSSVGSYHGVLFCFDPPYPVAFGIATSTSVPHTSDHSHTFVHLQL